MTPPSPTRRPWGGPLDLRRTLSVLPALEFPKRTGPKIELYENCRPTNSHRRVSLRRKRPKQVITSGDRRLRLGVHRRRVLIPDRTGGGPIRSLRVHRPSRSPRVHVVSSTTERPPGPEKTGPRSSSNRGRSLGSPERFGRPVSLKPIDTNSLGDPGPRKRTTETKSSPDRTTPSPDPTSSLGFPPLPRNSRRRTGRTRPTTSVRKVTQ